MNRHALQINRDVHGKFRWVLLDRAPYADAYIEHSAADCDFASHDDALTAGTVAMAMAAAGRKPFGQRSVALASAESLLHAQFESRPPRPVIQQFPER